GVLLTIGLIGGKGAELLVHPGDHRDRRCRGWRYAGAQRKREGHGTRQPWIDMLHVPLPSLERRLDLGAPVRSAQAAAGARHRAMWLSRMARGLAAPSPVTAGRKQVCSQPGVYHPHGDLLSQKVSYHIIAILSILSSVVSGCVSIRGINTMGVRTTKKVIQ